MRMEEEMKSRYRTGRTLVMAIVILVLTEMASSTEIRNDLPANHRASSAVPSAASLAMEARTDPDSGTELDGSDGKSASSSSTRAIGNDNANDPTILGSASRVAIVYSERNPADSVKGTEPIPTVEDRSWRSVKASARDSYLDALNHSHSSKDPREGVVRVDSAKLKVSKLMRREYSEGPVYRPVGEQYGTPKEKISPYVSVNDVNRSGTTKNVARISYGGPTREPFLPTPGDAYSLPIQSSVNFNDNNRGSYAAPQSSYGAPSSPDASYGPPAHVYGPPSIPQNSYGPPSNGYPPAETAHQAYGPPSPAYGAPYAIQDYSQHLPSLPSIDFAWPLALKINAFTVAKILLKLVIFKMIVKFIAVICLLLFIPKLEILKKGDKNDNDDDGDDSRGFVGPDFTLDRLNVLTALVTSSIEKYRNGTDEPVDADEDCTSFGCRMRKFMTHDESRTDYARLFESYVAEETDKDEDRGTRTNRVET